MTKKILSTAFLIFCLICNSQNKDKIKGNRVVTNQLSEVQYFTKLTFGDNFKVTLVQGCDPSVEIITDSNLHDVIAFNVFEGRLKFQTTHKITSSKMLDVRVIYTEALNTIELTGNAELTALTTLKLDTLKVVAGDFTKSNFNVISKKFEYVSKGKSKANLGITSNTIALLLKDNAKLTGRVTGSEITTNLKQHANVLIDGGCAKLTANLSETSKLNAENLLLDDAEILTKDKCNTTINVAKTLSIEAYGNTETVIYGKPAIDLIAFENNAVLRKKENKQQEE